jgi:Phosphatidylserine decarboxylase
MLKRRHTMMNNNDRNGQNRPGGNGKMPEKTPPSRGQRSIVLIIYLILFAGICYMWWQTSKSSDPVKEEWSDVRSQITSGDIEKITYTRNQNRGEVIIRKDSLSKYTGKIAEDAPKGSAQFFFLVSQTFDAEKELVDAQDQLPENHRFKVIMVQKENYWSHIFDWIFIGLMILFTFFILFRPMQGIGGAGGGGIFNVGKSQAKLYEKDNKVNVTFKDVAGLEEAKVEVMLTPGGEQVMFRQIAGIIARRIVCYAKEGDDYSQGEEAGFIKFGSRADIFLPKGSEVVCKVGDKVKSRLSILARI